MKGSRNKLGEEFLAKFAADVGLHGAEVIERVRTERPEVYLKIWADLLPRKAELDVNVDIDVLRSVTSAIEAYRTLSAVVGADPQIGLRRLKRLAPEIVDVEPS